MKTESGAPRWEVEVFFFFAGQGGPVNTKKTSSKEEIGGGKTLSLLLRTQDSSRSFSRARKNEGFHVVALVAALLGGGSEGERLLVKKSVGIIVFVGRRGRFDVG